MRDPITVSRELLRGLLNAAGEAVTIDPGKELTPVPVLNALLRLHRALMRVETSLEQPPRWHLQACAHCGSLHLEYEAWVDCNRERIYDASHDGDAWCPSCSEHEVTVVSLTRDNDGGWHVVAYYGDQPKPDSVGRPLRAILRELRSNRCRVCKATSGDDWSQCPKNKPCPKRAEEQAQ